MQRSVERDASDPIQLRKGGMHDPLLYEGTQRRPWRVRGCHLEIGAPDDAFLRERPADRSREVRIRHGEEAAQIPEVRLLDPAAGRDSIEPGAHVSAPSSS